MTTKDQIKVLGALSQGAAAWLVGRSSRTFRDCAAPRELDGSYNARALAVWLQQEAAAGDPLLGAGDSPGLERYRLAKAALAELELLERQRLTIPVAISRDIFGRLASMLRVAGEQIGKRHGAEAQAILTDALGEFGRALDRELPATVSVGEP